MMGCIDGILVHSFRCLDTQPFSLLDGVGITSWCGNTKCENMKNVLDGNPPKKSVQ
jgi:hypothetical protein